MTELSETGNNHAVAPDRISFSVVMELLSKQGSSRKVEDVLMRCKAMAEKNAELEPDRIMYNILLDSYAKQNHNDRDYEHRRATAAQEAEKLLRMMENSPSSLPTTISYNSVLNVFAKSSVPFERMDSILNEMNSKVDTGDESVKPDIITYNIILGAIARDGSKESMEKGLAFMQEMRDIGMEPDRITFNNLMDSIIKADRPGAAVLAESILDKMASEHDIQPDVSSYNVILNGYAKVGSVEAAQRAELILQTMVTLYQEGGRVNCRPDFVSYASVMDAYARSRGADAGFQADALLTSMMAADIVPNTICYNAAINCWAKSRHIDAPFRAESILNRMAQEELQNPSVKPNSVSFSTVMNCWAQSRQTGAAEKADALLGRMEFLAKAGNHDMLPNPYTYSTVISAWGKVGRSDKALAILNRVEKAFISGKSPVRPNFACYNAAINAIAKSRSEDKAEEAVAILKRMKLNFHEFGLIDTAPTNISYSSVLNACAYTVSKDPERLANAFRIARETFRELLQNEEPPTAVCYVNFLSACGRLLPPGNKRLDTAEAIFRDCQERGLMDAKVESTYQRIVSRSQRRVASTGNEAPGRPSWRSR
jgi:pentatricopeptide repeat protein